MPLAAKAAWQVTAGVLPGSTIRDYSKSWHYDSAEYEEDMKHTEEPGYQSIFSQKLALANAYCIQVTNPNFVNWVKLEFIWY